MLDKKIPENSHELEDKINERQVGWKHIAIKKSNFEKNAKLREQITVQTHIPVARNYEHETDKTMLILSKTSSRFYLELPTSDGITSWTRSYSQFRSKWLVEWRGRIGFGGFFTRWRPQYSGSDVHVEFKYSNRKAIESFE